VLMVTDTSTVPSGAPTLVMGLRGIIHLTVVLTGPRHDLHSGMHGGVAPNPAMALARLLATLHAPDGRIAVRGFEAGTLRPTARERALIRTAPFSARAYARLTGVPPAAGDRRFSPQERLGFRSAIEVNGIHSGYGGQGSKTIIPPRAEAKLTARLAAGQDPARCLAALIRHLQHHAPAGLRLEFPEQGTNGPAVRVRPDDPVVRRAAGVLRRLDPRRTAYLWDGASIPIITALAQTSGATPLLAGFGHDDDRIHAPDESFGIDQFRRGFLYAALMLQELGSAKRETRRKPH
jgi:acetylornithine deacetylase/succinyl-diaminopimelate desuccinylase-like protein